MLWQPLGNRRRCLHLKVRGRNLADGSEIILVNRLIQRGRQGL